MLKSLHISNYALIESVDIVFDRLLNIITGETGAGKSIMLGALGLIMGNRADLSMIRDKNRKTVVEAIFDISGRDNLIKVLEDNNLDFEDGECILRREITSRGGSRAFINDTPVNLSLLRDIALQLVDIHSQHRNLLLANADYQMQIIDSLANNQNLLDDYSTAYNAYRVALKKYTSTRDMLMRSQAEAEYMSFQLEQLDKLNLKPCEQNMLERERDLLANKTQIKSRLGAAMDFLLNTGCISANISKACDELSHLDDVYDQVDSLNARLETARIEINDIVDTISDLDSKLSANPADLTAIEDRLAAIYSLETRHHLESSDDLMALQDKIRSQLKTITNGDETLKMLESEARQAKKAAVVIAKEISARRNDAARRFEVELKERCNPLGLVNMRFEVSLNVHKLNASGADSVEFLFSFNKNQELTPVGKTASGGEISRVILAIKGIIAQHMALPTIIFDEVDTGVSGDIANRMAREMMYIAESTQVITITHLPQVAAKGKRHFKVYKKDSDTSTTTYINMLDSHGRERELALMISGDPDNEVALATARQLLDGK